VVEDQVLLTQPGTVSAEPPTADYRLIFKDMFTKEKIVNCGFRHVVTSQDAKKRRHRRLIRRAGADGVGKLDAEITGAIASFIMVVR
jgi:hypothetical protein